MPKGEQFDIDVSIALCEFLDIKYYTVNINDAYNGLMKELEKSGVPVNTQAITNLPPRIRMSTVYAVSQSVNGRVANTCNLSEDWVGYSTRYGDSVGDFSPLSKLTVQEVKAVGRALRLPEMFVEKVPIDGLCGKTDEDNLGFTYETLDRYIREGICEDEETKARIDRLHKINQFKLELMPIFPYEP
jgi:NAD+ synthase